MLLFDQNLSPRLVRQLEDVYPDSMHVREVQMETVDDEPVWRFAKSRGLCIVSKDDDFRQRATLRGPPPKVIWLDVGNCSTKSMSNLLRKQRSRIEESLADEDAAVLVLALHRAR